MLNILFLFGLTLCWIKQFTYMIVIFWMSLFFLLLFVTITSHVTLYQDSHWLEYIQSLFLCSSTFPFPGHICFSSCSHACLSPPLLCFIYYGIFQVCVWKSRIFHYSSNSMPFQTCKATMVSHCSDSINTQAFQGRITIFQVQICHILMLWYCSRFLPCKYA